MGEASLDGIEEVCASEIYPKKQLISEDSNQSVPYLPLPGESPNYIGSTTDGIIVLSNYRLYLSVDTIVNIPLGLIEQTELRDIFYLYIYCKDARSFRCTFPNNEQCQKWFKLIQEASLLPSKVDNLFAFVFYLWSRDEHKEDLFAQLCQPKSETVSETYNEAERMGFNHEYIWKITDVNRDYSFCPSYPRQIIVPASIPDEQLEIVANFRYSRRIPAVVWRHQRNGCVIARCSQPQVGWFGCRKQEDENLIQAIADACLMDPGLEQKCAELHDSMSMKSELSEEVSMLPGVQSQNDTERQKLLIIDARSYAAAVANRWKGGGCEWPDYYPNCEVIFLGLANIHSIRKSFSIVRTLCVTTPDQQNWLSSLENSKWLHHISSLIRAALIVVNAVDVEKRPVLVHCSDGWDRTPQIVALAELMMDPFYRSKKGFQVLVEREWLEFGHKFADRCGNSNGSEDLNERSPVFLQWLDCVHQIHKQFSCHFEFNRQYLVKLAHHTYSSLFGTFLCNTDQERSTYRIPNRTFSVWPFLNSNTSFHNYLYNYSNEVLRPSYQAKDIRFWKEVYSPTYSVPMPKVSMSFVMTPTCDETSPEETVSEGVPLVKTKSFDDISSIGHPCERQRRNSDPSIVENACFPESNQLPLKVGAETTTALTLDLESESLVPSNIYSSCDPSVNGETVQINADSERTECGRKEPANFLCRDVAIDGSTDTLVSENGVIQPEASKEIVENITSIHEKLTPCERLSCSVSTSTTDLTKDEVVLQNDDVFDHKKYLCYQSVLQALRKQASRSSSSCSYTTPRHSRTPSSGFPATPCDEADVSLSKGRAFPHQSLDIDGSIIITEEIQEQLQKLIRHYKRKVKHLENDLLAARTHFMHQVCRRCQARDGSGIDDDDNASLSDSVCSGEQQVESSAGSDVSWEQLEKPNTTLWVPDHAAACCSGCEARFWSGKRKHHCRKCGQVFCSNCSNRTTPVPMEQLFHPVRVCNFCFEELQTQCRQSVVLCDKMPKAVIAAASN